MILFQSSNLTEGKFKLPGMVYICIGHISVDLEITRCLFQILNLYFRCNYLYSQFIRIASSKILFTSSKPQQNDSYFLYLQA